MVVTMPAMPVPRTMMATMALRQLIFPLSSPHFVIGGDESNNPKADAANKAEHV